MAVPPGPETRLSLELKTARVPSTAAMVSGVRQHHSGKLQPVTSVTNTVN